MLVGTAPSAQSEPSTFHCEGAETIFIFLALRTKALWGNLFAILLLALTKLTALCTLPRLVAVYKLFLLSVNVRVGAHKDRS